MWWHRNKIVAKKEYDPDFVVANTVVDMINHADTLDEITAIGHLLRVLGNNRYIYQLLCHFNSWELDIRMRIVEDKLGLKAPERFIIDTKERHD